MSRRRGDSPCCIFLPVSRLTPRPQPAIDEQILDCETVMPGKEGDAVQLQVVTLSVKSLEISRSFYEEILGFEPDMYYEPTQWQSYRIDGSGGFGIAETPDLVRSRNSDIINFFVDDVKAMWCRVKDRVEIEADLARAPWGTYKFVIRDPDGFCLGFVGTPSQ